MKKLLLATILISTAYNAQAQLAQALSLGMTLGVRAAMSGKAGSQEMDVAKDAGVSSVAYKGQHFYQKRTPAAKLRNKPAVAQLETLLQTCYVAMTTDSTATVCSDAQWAAIQAAQAQLTDKYPNWNTDAYHHEKNFYLAEEARRQRQARALAKQQQLVQAQRLKVRQDSTARAATGQ